MRQTDCEPFLTLVSLGNRFRNKTEKSITLPPTNPLKKKKIPSKIKTSKENPAKGIMGYCLL